MCLFFDRFCRHVEFRELIPNFYRLQLLIFVIFDYPVLLVFVGKNNGFLLNIRNYNGCLCARGIDDRGGTYVVQEVLRRLSKEKMAASLTAVSTTQEEIGTRGAIPAAYEVHPDIGIAVDVGHATDFPDGDSNKLGEFKLGAGPIIARGPNISPRVFEALKACAERLKIPYQVEAESGPTGTDARVIQMSREGVATGLVSIPLRYMHTPHELVCLDDIEWVIQLLVEFTRSLKKNDKFEW